MTNGKQSFPRLFSTSRLPQSVLACALVVAAFPAPANASGPGNCKALLASPDPFHVAKPATAEDTRIFSRYVGEFHSEKQKFDDSEIEYYFSLNYEWFDEQQSILKFIVSMVVPEQERVLVRSEGYYGYDPFIERLYAFGAFKNGGSGMGQMTDFNHETGARSLIARRKNADGTVTLISDQFEFVSEGVWRNKAYACSEETGDWTLIYEGVYSRA